MSISDDLFKENESVPWTNLGKIKVNRTRLISSILPHCLSMRSVSVAGPMGSGKTVFLKMLARQLIDHGDVYLFEHPAELDSVVSQIVDLNERLRRENRKAFICVDEMQAWTGGSTVKLLKGAIDRLCVVGTGLPSAIESFRMFHKRFGVESMRLQWADIVEDSSVVKWYRLNLLKDRSTASSESGSSSGSSSSDNSEDVTEKLLKFLLDYTGGHAYPMLLLAEMMTSHYKEACYEDKDSEEYMQILGSAKFYESQYLKNIRNRSFSYSIDLYDPASVILRGFMAPEIVLKVSRAGLWDETENNFFSDLFVSIVLLWWSSQENVAVKLDSTIDLLEYALKDMTDSDFKQFEVAFKSSCSVFTRNRLENSISVMLALKMARVKGVIVSSQHIMGVKRTKQRPGHPPTVDFYIDSHYNTFVEVVRSGSDLDEHLRRFLDGKCKDDVKNDAVQFIVLDIELIKSEPKPSKLSVADYAKCSDKHYTYVLATNILYRGGNPLRKLK